MNQKASSGYQRAPAAAVSLWLWSRLHKFAAPLVALLASASILTVQVGLAGKPASQHGSTKATWLWEAERLADARSRTEIVQFAKSEHVGRIFVQIDTDADVSDYRQFIRSAAEAGIRVHALAGAPDWVLPQRRHVMAETVEWVRAYNRSAEGVERFDGIQIDVEPYLLDEWKQEQTRIAADWVETVKQFRQLVDNAGGLLAGAALPFWLDELRSPGRSVTMAETIMSELDEVALMTYRNRADSVIGLADKELGIGNRIGTKVFVGVETNRTDEGEHVSFYGAESSELNRQMAEIEEKLRNHRSYAGIAVHDYTGWSKMEP